MRNRGHLSRVQPTLAVPEPPPLHTSVPGGGNVFKEFCDQRGAIAVGKGQLSFDFR